MPSALNFRRTNPKTCQLRAESCGHFPLTWVTPLVADDRFVLGMTIVNIVNLTA